MNPITLTIDLEDPTENYAPNGRYVTMARQTLDLCDALRCRATFFTVGRVAIAAPNLVKEIAGHGHEIAYHSHAHVALTEENPVRFRRECRADKFGLEQLAGKPVLGFRAPRFSLMPQTAWALDTLREAGFRYSSSIMPTGLSLYGFPNAPRAPFLWPNGLIELPLPVGELGPLRVPYLGGIYLYALPGFATRWFLGRATPREVLWTYAHPYDFDTQESFAPMPHTPPWISLALWLARRQARPKIERILANGSAPPLGERVLEPGFAKDLAIYPAQAKSV